MSAKIVDTSDLFSSDILLFDLLEKEKEKNNVLKHFLISFPSESDLKTENEGIFIGFGRDVLKKETSDMTSYENQVIVLISSKHTDYKKAKTRIDLGTKEIIKTVKKSHLNHRNFKWTESHITYSSTYEAKLRRIIFSFDESYDWDSDLDEDFINTIFTDLEVN